MLDTFAVTFSFELSQNLEAVATFPGFLLDYALARTWSISYSRGMGLL